MTWLSLTNQAHLKVHQANDSKPLKKVRTLTDRMVQLTGTPSPNGPIDVWSQNVLLDGGERFGKTNERLQNAIFGSRLQRIFI